MCCEMNIWQMIDDLLKKYYLTNDKDILDLIILDLDPYIKSCAHRFVFKAQSNGVFIPFEDFYSNLCLAIWEGIEDFVSQAPRLKMLRCEGFILLKRRLGNNIKNPEARSSIKMGLLMT